jgi:hypothetical protein
VRFQNLTPSYPEPKLICTDLALNGKRLDMFLQSPSLQFASKRKPMGMSDERPDLPNLAVNVLVIDIPPGTHTVVVIFSPLWDPGSRMAITPLVPLDEWALRSHDS